MMAALDAGADDIVDEGDTWRVTLRAERRRGGAGGAGGGRASRSTSAESTMISSTDDRRWTRPRTAKRVLRVIDALEEHDDVQDVYANFDIPDDVLDAVEA